MLREITDQRADRAHDFQPREDDPASLVAARLRRSGYPYLRGVKCEVREGVAVLSGTVPTFHLKQMAQALAEAGADVVITSRSAESAEKSAKELAEYTGRKIIGTAMDVTDEDSVTRAFDMTIEKMGRLDILVNNAGGTIPSDNYKLEDRGLEEWRYAMRVNLDGTFLCTRAAARIMLKQRSGSIINIASDSGILGIDRSRYEGLDMKPNTVDYAAVKGGIINFTRDAAAELSPQGIRVNAISPGGFERGQKPEFIERYNKLTALRRMGIDGRDLKGIIVLLASDAGDYITGANILVDGGITAVK